MIRLAVFLGLALAVPAVQEGSPALEPAVRFEQGCGEARAELVRSLLELADWCKREKLPAGRAELLSEVLRLEPANEAARLGLGHQRQRDGSWKEPSARKPGRDPAGPAVLELALRRAALEGSYRERCIALLEEHASALPRGRRAALAAELLARDPESPRARALGGEVRGEKGWILAETSRSQARREELRELVKALYAASSEPRAAAPLAREAALGLELTRVVDLRFARVLGTGSAEEVDRFARVLEVAPACLARALGVAMSYYPETTAWLLARPGEKERFLSAHPELSESSRKFLAKLEGSGLPGTAEFAHWAAEERLRLDGATRLALSALLHRGLGITPEHGWAFEGLGLYLTRELVGTRLTWFVQPSDRSAAEQDQGLRLRLLDSRTNWMEEAKKLLASPRPPRLSILLGKDVGRLSPEELLYSYVLACYLVEGRPDETPALLRAIGEGHPAPAAIAEHLGLELPDLEQRLRRWLAERP